MQPYIEEIYEKYYAAPIIETLLKQLELLRKQGPLSLGQTTLNNLIQKHAKQAQQRTGKPGAYRSIKDGGPGWHLKHGYYNQPIKQAFQNQVLPQLTHRELAQPWNMERVSETTRTQIRQELAQRDLKHAFEPQETQTVTPQTKRTIRQYEELGITKFNKKMGEIGYTPSQAIMMVGKHERKELQEI